MFSITSKQTAEPLVPLTTSSSAPSAFRAEIQNFASKEIDPSRVHRLDQAYKITALTSFLASLYPMIQTIILASAGTALMLSPIGWGVLTCAVILLLITISLYLAKLLAETKGSMKDLKSHIQHVEERLRQCQQENQLLQKKEPQIDARFQDMQEQITQLRQQQQQPISRAQIAETVATQVRLQLAQDKTKQTALIGSLQTELRSLQQTLKNSEVNKQTVMQLSKQVETLQATLNANSLEKMQHDLDNLKEEQDELSKEFESDDRAKTGCLEILDDKINQVASHIESLTQEVRDLAEQREQDRAQIELANISIASHQSGIDGLIKHLAPSASLEAAEPASPLRFNEYGSVIVSESDDEASANTSEDEIEQEQPVQEQQLSSGRESPT